MKLLALLFPLFLLANCTHTPITATSNKVGHEVGKACARNILFIIPLSTDNSIYTAAMNGQIEKISTVDANGLYTLFYNSTCTIVRGHKKSDIVKVQPMPEPIPTPEKISEPEAIEDEVLDEDPVSIAE